MVCLPKLPYLRKLIQLIYFSSNFVIVSCFAHKLHLPTGQDCLGENISQEKLRTPNIHASWWFHLKNIGNNLVIISAKIGVLKPPPPCVKQATFPKQIPTIQRQFRFGETPWITFFLGTTHGATTILALNFGSSIPPQLGGFTQQRCWKIGGIFYEQNVSKRSYEQKSQSISLSNEQNQQNYRSEKTKIIDNVTNMHFSPKTCVPFNSHI